MRAQFIRGENPIETMELGLSRRSIKKYDKKEQAFFYGIDKYDRDDWSDFLEVPFSKIYLIAKYDEPNFDKIKKYIDRFEEEDSVANSSHQVISYHETDLGKVIIGLDMMDDHQSEKWHCSIWGDAKTYMNFKDKF